VLSGCTIGSRPEPLPPVHEPTPGVDPDVVVASHTLAAEQAMLDRVGAVIARHPGLQPRLSTVAVVHQAHVQLLTRAVPGSASPSGTATGTASPSPTGTASPSSSGSASPTTGPSSASPGPDTTEVPRKPADAVRWLADHENALCLFDKQQAFTARSGAFARLLASMAAAAAQQAVLLGSPAHGPGGGR